MKVFEHEVAGEIRYYYLTCVRGKVLNSTNKLGSCAKEYAWLVTSTRNALQAHSRPEAFHKFQRVFLKRSHQVRYHNLVITLHSIDVVVLLLMVEMVELSLISS